jgi:hypothetical protein
LQELLSQLEDNVQNVSSKAVSSEVLCTENREKIETVQIKFDESHEKIEVLPTKLDTGLKDIIRNQLIGKNEEINLKSLNPVPVVPADVKETPKKSD